MSANIKIGGKTINGVSAIDVESASTPGTMVRFTEGGGIPTVTITLSQVISQDPLTVQLTQEQIDIVESIEVQECLLVDVTEFGLGVLPMVSDGGTGYRGFTIVQNYTTLSDLTIDSATIALLEYSFSEGTLTAYQSERLIDTSDADAIAEDILEGKTAYVDGEKITGTASGGASVKGQKRTYRVKDGETITAGDFVSILDYYGNGEFLGEIPSYIKIVRLDTNMYVFTYGSVTSQNYVTRISFSDGMTVVSPFVSLGNISSTFGIIAIDDRSFIMANVESETLYVRTILVDFNTGTSNVGEPQALASASSNYTFSVNIEAFLQDSSTGVIFYSYYGGANYSYANYSGCATFDITSLSLIYNARQSMTSSTSYTSSYFYDAERIDENNYIVYASNSWVNNFALIWEVKDRRGYGYSPSSVGGGGAASIEIIDSNYIMIFQRRETRTYVGSIETQPYIVILQRNLETNALSIVSQTQIESAGGGGSATLRGYTLLRRVDDNHYFYSWKPSNSGYGYLYYGLITMTDRTSFNYARLASITNSNQSVLNCGDAISLGDSLFWGYSNNAGIFKQMNNSGGDIASEVVGNAYVSSRVLATEQYIGVAADDGSGNQLIDVYIPYKLNPISVIVQNATYTITLNYITHDQTSVVVFTPSEGYEQPDEVSVFGAIGEWNKGTGTLTLSNPSGMVSVNYSATQVQLDTPTIALSGNTLTISSVPNATGYIVTAATDTTYTITITETITETTLDVNTWFNDGGADTGEYTISVVATGSPYADSNTSNTVTFSFHRVVVEATATVTGVGSSDPSAVTFDVDDGFTVAGIGIREVTKDGDTFIKIPTLYRKVNTVVDDQITSFTVSTTPVDDSYIPYSVFFDESGNLLDYVLVGKYWNSSSSNMISQSESGAVSMAIGTGRTYARARGAGYQQYDWQFQKLWQDLIVIFKRTINTNPGTTAWTYDEMGIYWGANSGWIDGICHNSAVIAVSDKPSKYVDSATASSDGYFGVSYNLSTTSTGNITKLGYDSAHPFVSYPSDASGSSYTSYYCDGYWYSSGSQPVNSRVGEKDASRGAFLCGVSDGWSNSRSVRLCYRPISETST